MDSATVHPTVIPGARFAWLRPTRRAIDWTSLAVVTLALFAAQALLAWRGGEVPEVVGHLAVAAVAAAVALGLDDPARPLLEASPTSFSTRLGHRLIVLSGGTALALAALAGSGQLLAIQPPATSGLATALVALVAAGVGVHALAAGVIEHPSEAAAAAILLWVLGSVVVPPQLIPEGVASAWLDHPWPVAVLAMVVTLATTSGDRPLIRRRGPA